MTDDPYDLRRFVDAQERIYETVIDELAAGRKKKPLDVVRVPATARPRQQPDRGAFGISSSDEARAYLAHELLGPRLRECARLVTRIDGLSAEEIFGWPDDIKLRSSMTLFARAAADNADFVAVLEKYYGGEEDPATLARLS